MIAYLSKKQILISDDKEDNNEYLTDKNKG